ncbi:MAG: DUF4252 domain-containing protein [Tannerella sp.]|jgi:hypothetical protein|nr:DUF4252 domain-containing protein [Tannerella sp.]
MKTRHLLFCLCLFCTNIGFAQNKVFEKYADMENVTSVYISKAMFQMMPIIEQVGVNLVNMKGKIESLQLVSTEKKEMIAQMKKEFSQLVTTQHEELMRVKDDSTRVNFYSNMKGNQIKDLLMLVESNTNYTAIMIVGNFTLNDIQEIAGQY